MLFRSPAPHADALSGYDLVVHRDGVEWQRVRAGVDPSTPSPSQVLTVDNGHDYRVAVVATNKAGSGPMSALSPSVRSFGAPGRVEVVSATASGVDGTVVLSFALPPDNGSPVLSYRVVSSVGARFAGRATAVDGTVTGTVGGLLDGTGYRFLVAACNATRCGPYSPWSTEAVPFGPPGAPRLATSAGPGSAVLLHWDAGAAANGRPVDGVEIAVDGGPWRTVAPSGSVTVDSGYGATHSLMARTLGGGLRSGLVLIVGVAAAAPGP